MTPYQAPNLPLKIDAKYANTGDDVEPYGGVAPYKRHFLTQMEYTGAGRSIPEPGLELKTVKLGFIGPTMSTVSVATGGKSHEEALGIRMLQGARLASSTLATRRRQSSSPRAFARTARGCARTRRAALRRRRS